MAEVFLYGDIDETFAEVTAPFVDAAVRIAPSIALLLQGGDGWEQYVARYEDPWRAQADVEVVPIVPVDGRVAPAQLETLAEVGGIFMGGGHTPAYHAAFVTGDAGPIIRSRIADGVPYGGVSAGALLAGPTSILAGNTADGRRIAADAAEAAVDLVLGDGLGLVDDVIVEAHLTELGHLPRLMEALLRTDCALGIGIDEPAAVHISGKEATVLGRGRVYVIHTRPASVVVEPRRPGDRFVLSRSD